MELQIVRSEMKAYHAARPCHHFPCSFMACRENPLIGLNPFSSDLVFEPVSELLWDEDEFLLAATLGISESQSSLSNIRRGEL